MKLPISLIIDDPAPRVFVFYEHAPKKTTDDGRPLLSEVPNSFLLAFCDVTERFGLRGKYSVVPMPGGRGDIVGGIPGFPDEEIREWLDIVRERVSRNFSICPEMLTHAGAVDLDTGAILSINERDWAATQDASALTPYIAKALDLLRCAGLTPSGVTSPWDFGIEVEEEYVRAISDAFAEVLGRKDCWYFLRSRTGKPDALPWVALNEEGRRVVSFPNTCSDCFWQTMNTTDTSEEYISRIADNLLTEDGSAGQIVDVMAGGGWPILIAHWQSLFSNGLWTGLRALAEVARRVEIRLSDRVRWMSAEEVMNEVLADPGRFPKPRF